MFFKSEKVVEEFFSTLLLASAKRLVLPNKQLLKEFSGHMSFSKMWAQCFLKCMGFVQRKVYIKEQVYCGKFF